MKTKLIRDKLVHRIGLRKGEKIRLAWDGKEFDQLLLKKLDEEYGELMSELRQESVDVDRVIEEAADLIEVVAKVADRWASADLECVLRQLKVKRGFNGRFDAGVVLETKGEG